jgi:hypothetical protein
MAGIYWEGHEVARPHYWTQLAPEIGLLKAARITFSISCPLVVRRRVAIGQQPRSRYLRGFTGECRPVAWPAASPRGTLGQGYHITKATHLLYLSGNALGQYLGTRYE